MLALLACACGRGRPHIQPGDCRGCNVLLVTIDTLRLDRVGAFGSTRGLTPTLDRLASSGLRVTRAYASAPLTLPSHTSILTAVPPPVHGVRANGLFRLGPQLPTLATVLKSAGYRTGAFVGAFVLDARFGLTRGFDVYDDHYGEKHEGDRTEGAERRAEEVTRPALAWITSQGAAAPPAAASRQPWFAWIHLYDPHEPYDAPEPWRSQHEPYDAEVAYTDATIGRLIDNLKAAGQLDSTLVLVCADHGESLGEHGERTHGSFVYDATMRVPWIVWSASGAIAGRIDDLVQLIDVAPTALDLVGVASPREFEGRSLARPKSDGASVAYLEAMDANVTRNWAPLTAIVSGTRKFVDLPIPELYDLAADPGESSNVYARDGDTARTLDARLRDLRASFDARAAGADKTVLGSDARQRLQALGYTASSADASQRIYTDADDPKTLVPVSNELNDAVAAFNRGDRSAVARVAAIVRQHPRFSTAAGELALMQRRLGDLPSAIATLDGLAKRGAADPRSLVILAGLFVDAGDFDRATAIADAVIAAHPDFVDAYNARGLAAMRRGRHDAAQQSFRKMLELDPGSSTAYANMAADDLAARKLPDAADALTHAVALDPRNFDALYNLGMALDALGRRDEARPYLERFAAQAPPQRYGADIAHVRKLLGK
ncbi:MAG TPA: sulfatase-like hydrolase/transferase [Vicinamibacterales bacterium]|nr:sulfatase-like hydrolase/transferase [Vicinamibacterales bacterium]